VNAITKREFEKNPSIISQLKSGESIEISDGKKQPIVVRRKRKKPTAEEIALELERICKNAPPMNALAVLNDLRG
jgi:hypothetical protein